jgi:glycosyltransferase involved in cell wall biosynthesis
MTLVSVIVPTYNRTDLLMGRCLPSVVAQTVDDWECHVVGDGTEQATMDAMAHLCAADRRFRFTNLPHYTYPDDPRQRWGTLGLAALNFGLDYAQGDWIAVLADDDEWTPDHHEVLLRAQADSGADHVYGMALGADGQVWGAWPPGDGQFTNGANLYRASLPYRYNVRSMRETGVTGDADMWLRMLAGGVAFHFEPAFVHHYFPSRWDA